MTPVAYKVPSSFGADTIYTFNAESAARLKAAQFNGNPLTFLWRYGSDVSLNERDAILNAGWILLLVSHVRNPGWQTGGAAAGTIAGQKDVFHAQRLGYPQGCHLAIDMEGLGDQGQTVVDYIRARCAIIIAAGFKVAMYEGYDDGLTMALRLALSDLVDVYWSDYGTRVPPPGIGFVCKQHAQCMVAGIEIDPDECFGVDLRGRSLVGMMLADPAAPDTGDPVAQTEHLIY